MFDFLKPKTVKSIMANIYKQIDELEIVAEQQQFLIDDQDERIKRLVADQRVAAEERNHAERVAAKLRSLIEV